MTVYTVHEPRPRKNEDASDPERFVFVRDGFYFWAFLLGPLWMLWRGLWVVLLIYVVGMIGGAMALRQLGVSGAVVFTIWFLIRLLIGFEAASLQRWAFARRGWKNLGLVVAPDIESAERRFYDTWMARRSAPQPVAASSPVASAPPRPHMASATAGVIGLFPEPEPRPRP